MGSNDTTVRLWNTATGKEELILRGHSESVFAVSFSPDGKRLASASVDGTLRLWDVTAGDELAILRGDEEVIRDLTFSPDGTRLAAASWDTIRIWDTEPYRVRYPERRAILAARREVELIVDSLWQQSGDARSIADRLRADASLSEPQRAAALDLLLTKSSQFHSRLQEHVNELFARLVFSDDVVAALERDDSLNERQRRDAVTIARQLGDGPHRINVRMYELGCAAALLGDRDEALDRLRRSVDYGWTDWDWMAKDPDLESLHGDPEFEAIVAEAKRQATPVLPADSRP